jgi:glycerophosphoryl diester phosphodiesterase
MTGPDPLSRRRLGALLAALALAPLALRAAIAQEGAMTRSGERPIIIAHRGASGERPEHTLEAYALAIAQGADVIEPDLVITKDGVLVARHENEISETTDVADRPEFAARRTSRTIDGQPVSGWFTEDFTLAELKTLHARERLPRLRPASASHDGRYRIPTFAEVLALARSRGVGVYPETKHPSYFRALGLPLEEPLLGDLARAGWNRADAPVWIQSFEVGNLKALRSRTPVRLVQLIAAQGGPADGGPAYGDMLTDAGLAAIAAYAWGIGPQKSLLLAEGEGGRLVDTGLARRARAAGLGVHAWTVRAENLFLPAALRRGADPAAHGDMAGEVRTLLAAGATGLFCDFPGACVAARDATAG